MAKRIFTIISLSVLTIVPNNVSGQVSIGTGEGPSRDYIICVAMPRTGNLRYSSGVSVNHREAPQRFKHYSEEFARKNGLELYPVDCTAYDLIDDGYLRTLNIGHTYSSNQGQIQTLALPGLPADWATRELPKAKSTPPANPARKRVTVDYAPAGLGKSGYRNASIDIEYRFILCGDEVQVAYSLDRQSLKHSEKYLLSDKNGSRELQPDTAPPKPIAIPVSANIRKGGYMTGMSFVDKIAGESLGMGCFTGQTKTLGKVGSFFTNQPSREEMQSLLDGIYTLDIAALPFALSQPSVRDVGELQREADATRANEENSRRQAEAAVQRAAEAKAVNDRIAADRAEFARKQAEYEKGVAKAAAGQKKYEADQASYAETLAKSKKEQEAYQSRIRELGLSPQL